MKLGNIIRAAGTARPVNPRTVEFTAVGRDLNTFRHIVAPAKAVFVFVDEDQREALRVEARTYYSRKRGSADIRMRQLAARFPAVAVKRIRSTTIAADGTRRQPAWTDPCSTNGPLHITYRCVCEWIFSSRPTVKRG